MTAYPLLFALLVALFPVLLALALVRDVLQRKRLAGARSLLFVLWYLACEIAGVLAAFGIWTLSKLGAQDAVTTTRYYTLQWWWARTLFGALRLLFRLELAVTGLDELEAPRGTLVLMRHTSMADTLLPGVLLSSHMQLRLRYVLKRELLWDPCLDLVGNQLPNVFVSRGSDQSLLETQRVGELARTLGAGEGVLLYPEGTRFTAERREKLLQQLREQKSSRLASYEALRHVLPARRGGTFALLDAAPTADVIVCVHRGFESVAGFGNLIDGSLIGGRVEVEFWSIPRAQVPEDSDARSLWLEELWKRVDAWVEARATGSANERDGRNREG